MLRRRASVETALKQFASAESDAREALRLLLQDTRAGEFSQSTGLAYLTLARCLAAEGRDTDARALAKHAVDQLEKSVGAEHPDTRSARDLAGVPAKTV